MLVYVIPVYYLDKYKFNKLPLELLEAVWGPLMDAGIYKQNNSFIKDINSLFSFTQNMSRKLVIGT